ncbi:MAG: peroxiredoxin family protein [Candidatus Promineifilaceae bacterium]|jgi:uncharacterized protein YdeI (BOF family)
MKTRIVLQISFLAILAVLATACGAVSEQSGSEKAPDFTLPDDEGNMVSLAETLQENEYVALVFYHSHT